MELENQEHDTFHVQLKDDRTVGLAHKYKY